MISENPAMERSPKEAATAGQTLGSQDNLRPEPVLLAVLFVLAVVFFVAVTGLSRIYHAQQESLANRWSSRGGRCRLGPAWLRRWDEG